MKRTLVLLASVLAAGVCSAADALYLSRPFDEIKLDENNNNAVLKVQPLPFPGRRLSPAADRQDELEIELLERPGDKYRVPWLNIVAVRLFEEMVLAEANQLVLAGKFDEAYGYFQFLEAQYPKTAGLKEAVENYLYVQIGAHYRNGQDDQALALAVELHRRNPQRSGLAVAYERITLRLVAARLASKNYAAARGLLKNLADRYPATETTSVAPLVAQLQQTAAGHLAAAQGHFAAGRFRQAEESCRLMLEVWPDLEGGRQLAASIREKYPVVTVGVTLPLAAPPASGARPLDWAATRTVPLLASYSLAGATPAEARFVVAEAKLAGQKQPREILERPFADSASALRALRRGECLTVDRISPWELKRLAQSPQIAIVPYGVPSVHLLVPNWSKPLVANRHFRRGVLSATDREGILRRGLLDGQNIAGCQVLAGPLPQALSPGGPGLAADRQPTPRPYDPTLAAVLLKLAADEAGAEGERPLVLVHAAEPVARVACQSLARQLDFVGQKVTLHELTAGQAIPTDWDLRYATVVCRDPAANAQALLGAEGLAGQCSAALGDELRLLAGASDAAAKTAQLEAIQRLAAAELPLIPLWQLAEHAAVHISLAGVGERPSGLYDNVQKWQLAAATESP